MAGFALAKDGLTAVFADSNWTDWLPTYAWVIEHRDGVVVVDTGQGLPTSSKPASHSILTSAGKLSFGLSVKKRSAHSYALSASVRAM